MMNFRASITSFVKNNRFIHFLSLFILSVFAFTYNRGLLLQGNDGPTNISIAEAETFLTGISPYLHSNFLEGIGNIFFPFNLTFQPGFWLSAHGNMTAISQGLLYTWFAIQLFVSVLFIGYNYGFSKRTSYGAAWLLTLIAFPYFSMWRIYPLTVNTPEYLNIITIFALIDYGIQRMGNNGWLQSIPYVALVVFGVMLGLIICPAHVLLIIPLQLACLVYALMHAPNKAAFQRKIILSIGILAFFAAVGWVEYFLGLMMNTAAYVFYAELEHIKPSLSFVSILYHGSDPGAKLGPIFFLASLGGVYYTFRYSPKFKALAITIAFMQCFSVLFGTLVMKMSHSWSAPEPIYFEMVILPFLALFLVHACLQASQKSKWSLQRLTNHQAAPLVFAGIIILAIYLWVPHSTHRQGLKLKPRSTAIVKILEDEIKLEQNSPYRGRVANILPHRNTVFQSALAGNLDHLTGNDHQSTGLWLRHIPTLHEYNQLLTPGFYYMYRTFLTDSSEGKPYRSWSNFSVVNPKILRLMGVKFVLSDAKVVPEGKFRAKVSSHVDVPDLYLFELNDVNTSGISASKVTFANSIQQTANLMSKREYDLGDAVLNAKVELPNLVEANNSSININKNGLHVTASSKGSSLLILPLEYSNCLRVDVRSGTKPTLMRVDIALTGLLFTGKTDVVLDNRVSLFDNPGCRLKDYLEFKQLWKA